MVGCVTEILHVNKGLKMKEALYYEKLDNQRVKCLLCPHYCTIDEGKIGICRARVNNQGILYSKVYAQCSAISMDPIEKKPLYHLAPGTQILSVSTLYCNFKCQFCQNWHLSQAKDVAPSTLATKTHLVSSEELLEHAQQNPNSIGIAYTYNEPIIWYEFVLDTAKLFKKHGLKNVLVTNGFINQEPLLELLPYIDGLNIDIKSFRDDFYKRLCFGRLEPVLETAKISKERGALVEITNLIIPTLNDNQEEISGLVDWVTATLGDDTPIHFSAYMPNYKINIHSTPFSTLETAYKIASKKLKYIYLGNIRDKEFNTTYCPKCKKAIIIRDGYYNISSYRIINNRCEYCQEKIYGYFK